MYVCECLTESSTETYVLNECSPFSGMCYPEAEGRCGPDCSPADGCNPDCGPWDVDCGPKVDCHPCD